MKTKEELNSVQELPDEVLEQVDGGKDWKEFGYAVLKNGGGTQPDLRELVAAIVSQNWPRVAILAAGSDNPIVRKSWNEC